MLRHFHASVHIPAPWVLTFMWPVFHFDRSVFKSLPPREFGDLKVLAEKGWASQTVALLSLGTWHVPGTLLGAGVVVLDTPGREPALLIFTF